MGIGSALKDLQGTFSSGGLNKIFGGGPVGDGGSGEAAAAEEARKALLRRKINTFYGIGPEGARPTLPAPANGGFIARAASTALAPQVQAQQGAYDADSAQAADATQAMNNENTQLSDATRKYYADQLARSYQKAERTTRFALARTGNMGGSEDAFQQGEAASDRDLGATRVDDAVRRSVANLVSQREQERLNSINLVNAGAGDSAVSAAQAGLRNSFNSASSAQKADLFGDLFTGAADAGAASNLSAQNAAIAARYRNQLATFFPNTGTTSGRVSPTG